MVTILSILVLAVGIINLFRMALFLIGADIYAIQIQHKKRKKVQDLPKISIVIPAFNEGKSILKTISSILYNKYPLHKVEIIVVNDGSNDNTDKIISEYVATNKITNVIIVNQQNLGKAHALNNGIKNHATGEIVMCLDGDSYIAEDALANAVKYFLDKDVMAVASNVKVVSSKGFFNLIQRFEYIICYQMKKAQTAFNIEYIVGGIGSIFRRSALEKINYYDTDTITEDIDITMKLLRNGNKPARIVYASDVVAYTQGALTTGDLIKQRYRWKWGRYQTFMKNKDMFFSSKKIFTKGLSWLYLPFTLVCDVLFFVEPLIVLFMLFLIITFNDISTLLSAISVLSFYMIITVLGEDTISLKDKIKYVIIAPFMYFFFYLLSFVEYYALIKSLWNMPKLKESLTFNEASWLPIQRKGYSN